MSYNNVTNNLLDNLYKKPKKDKGKNMTRFLYPRPGNIYQTDILFLPEDNGYKYALVVVDLGTRYIDAYPMKSKKHQDIIDGFELMFGREPLRKTPEILHVDAGTEFKGRVQKWIEEQDIILKVKKPFRHRQQAVVERANQEIGKMLFKRMTGEELLTKTPSTSWVQYLPQILKEINDKRRKAFNKRKPQKLDYQCEGDSCNALEQGTKVRVALDAPIDVVTGKRLPGNFRDSDIRWSIEPRTIMLTIIKPGQPPLYLLDDGKGGIDKRASYTKNQLQKVPENEKLPDHNIIYGQTDDNITRFIVEKLVDRIKRNGRIYFKVKWAGYPSSQNTWEKRSDLIRDIPEMIREYEKK